MISSADSTAASAPVVQTGEGGSIPTSALQKLEYSVIPVPLKDAQRMVTEFHYSRGGSNTAVYTHGLVHKTSGKLLGVAWWLPPTRVACESVNRESWKKVLSLTRLVCLPEAPKNSASFLLAHSVRLIKRDARFVSLVTYADESQGHRGQIYRAAGWDYVGRTGPYPRWKDVSGRQVACKATKNRTKSQMETLGFVMDGKFFKHKFVLHL
jgi:hypothetical protein